MTKAKDGVHVPMFNIAHLRLGFSRWDGRSRGQRLGKTLGGNGRPSHA
jgi:hypothetical protein